MKINCHEKISYIELLHLFSMKLGQYGIMYSWIKIYKPFYTTGNVKTIHEIFYCLLFFNCLLVYLFIVFNATFNNISVTIYRGSQFYWWRKLQFLEKITNCKYLLKYTGRQKLKWWEQNKFHKIIEFVVQLFGNKFTFFILFLFLCSLNILVKVFLRKSY